MQSQDFSMLIVYTIGLIISILGSWLFTRMLCDLINELRKDKCQLVNQSFRWEYIKRITVGIIMLLAISTAGVCCIMAIVKLLLQLKL